MTSSRTSRAESEFAPRLTRAFAEHRAFLFGLCYRMTGSAADAEDLLQDTFVRALRSPPEDLQASLRPWLSRIAVNLCCDHLRRRKLRKYRGTWLPEPLPTAELLGGQAEGAPSDARYDLLESATYAFLLALEALTPSQRAVLILRDVFDYSVRDTAQALSLSLPNVKTTLHRARAAMLAYDTRRCRPTPALRKQTERALRRFVLHLMTDDVAGIEALLREDVVALNDPGDEFVAARKAVVGRDKVVFFNRKLFLLTNHDPRFAFGDFNGLPAVILEYAPERRDFPPRVLFRIELDEKGRIREMHAVVASAKLGRVPFEGLRRPSWVERLTVAGLRKLAARRPTKARKPSRHTQVHPGSRARR